MYPSQRVIPKGNVAAVEPYIHTPQKIIVGNGKSKSMDQTHQQQQSHQQLIHGLTNLKMHLSHANGPTTNNNKNGNTNTTNINVNHLHIGESDETKLAIQKLHIKQHSLDFDSTDLTDFIGKHNDTKYQTLPYSSAIKPGINKIPVLMTRSPSKIESNDSDSAKADDIKKQHTVHSIPLNVANKSMAIAMANTFSPSTSAALHSDSGEECRSSDDQQSKKIKQSIGKQLVVPPRKPISSVAPTNVIITSKILTTPRVHAVAPNITNTKSIMSIGIVEDDKLRPALPPKPSKGSSSDHETSPQSTSSTSSSSSTSVTSQSSSIPTKTRLSYVVNSTSMLSNLKNAISIDDHMTPAQHLNVDNLPIKAKPLTIRKQPLSEQPRLRSSTSGIKPIQYTSRRIEMPPAFFFPEIEKTTLKSDNSTDNNNKNLNSQKPTNISNANNNKNSSLMDGKQHSPSGSNSSSDEGDKSTNSSVSSDDKTTASLTSSLATHNDVVRRPRSSLSDSNKVKLTRRVSFDPLALLLDASLEGELELVQKTAMQVNYITYTLSFSVYFSLFIYIVASACSTVCATELI